MAASRRSSAYLRLLHSRGEGARTRTMEELRAALHAAGVGPVDLGARGAMAYAVISPR